MSKLKILTAIPENPDFRASQIAKVGRNFAPRGSFASFFKVIFRSDLIFPIGSGLGVSFFQSKFLVKKH